ncbi:MAG: hypothetical protein N5P05_002993 [Chroococcopsis gigantea SAG 12.99]|jgi:predicted O-linked N-acetylglucosamine transferase (SPINDLY family)|nr:O-linked N-acetylglucosamine transferase, SPINDLY family protein [Chlorogloea purpurea SAG 13.99]MDV3001387.1 hypothetical protein [Chroococcopsis gigantea SAG 12.99]
MADSQNQLDVNNSLNLILSNIKLDQFNIKQIEELLVIGSLQNSPQGTVDENLLKQVLPSILNVPSYCSVNFAQASLKHFSNADEFASLIWQTSNSMAYEKNFPSYSADLLEITLEVHGNNVETFNQLVWFNLGGERFQKAIFWAEKFYEQFKSLELNIIANHCLLYSLISSGAWLEAEAVAQRHKQLLEKLYESKIILTHTLAVNSLQGLVLPLVYLQDNPVEIRKFQNYLSSLFGQLLPWKLPDQIPDRTLNRPLKIGYIGHTLRRHSIGWLSRWLIHHHDRNNFKVHIYLIHQINDALTQSWFMKPEDKTYNFQRDPVEVAEQIRADAIDILVDLDSVTANVTCQVMALKPAPVQITWLGFDASGIPAINYFLADNYVLPPSAEEYYGEKIWRLPNCYIAVDGCEVGIPSLRRESLNIPLHAVIYLSVQTGMKRNPSHIELQMQILKSVPDSYLVIQGLAHSEIIQKLFTGAAAREGINLNRLRFLPSYETEVYRANLSIADVVLDTYPFSGGTTTLDILWMGIPVVTKVGQQWASRNSYTLLTNVGVTEGIAWTDEEYIDWGVKLGNDANLRRKVREKLRLSKRVSPVWNGELFTRNVESAYRQMWARYCGENKNNEP